LLRQARVLSFASFMVSFWELRKATISLQRLSDIKPETNNTVSLFLYDIKENMELRNNEPQVRRGNGQVSIVRAPLRLACSYLITAWTGGDQEYSLLLEHQLLSQALQLLSRHHFLPRYFLQGSLQAQEPLPPLATLQAESLKNASEFWTAAQQKLRPALNVLATISMQPFEAQAEQIVTQPPEIDFTLPPPGIEGRILRDGQPLARALVSLVEADETTATDFKGRYRFKAAQTSKAYTLRVRVNDASGFRVSNVAISTRAKRDKDSTTPYLQVRVTDDQGNPVAGAVVTVAELGPGNPVDAAGQAEFFRVPPRTYTLRIESQNVMLETNVIVPKARS
jgi:protocatechuate 3,4-dioxygenase beta subunit